MDDGELQAIRAARIKELQAQQGGRAQTAGGAQQDNIDPETKRQQDAAGRHAMLSQILDAPARDRLSRIAIVKSDRARAVEDLIMRMAQGGQIRQKITESELVGLLEVRYYLWLAYAADS